MLAFYTGYQRAFQQYPIDFGKRLAEFEEEQKEDQPPNSKGVGIVPRQKADMAYRLWDALNRSGWGIGGLLAGGDLARRALNATILPPLRRVAEAIIPRFIRSVLGPLLTTLGRLNCFFTILKVGCVLFDDGPYFLGRLNRIFGSINAASY